MMVGKEKVCTCLNGKPNLMPTRALVDSYELAANRQQAEHDRNPFSMAKKGAASADKKATDKNSKNNNAKGDDSNDKGKVR